MNHKTKGRMTLSRRGLSLLEVILAIAILAGSIAAIGELVRGGLISATDARDYTRAEIYAESIMSQIVAGVLPATAIGDSPVEDDVNFNYAVQVLNVDDAGLLEVQVTVYRNPTSQRKPAEFTLVRWLVDPEMEMQLAEQAALNAQAAAEAQSAASSSSSSSSSSTTTPGTGAPQ